MNLCSIFFIFEILFLKENEAFTWDLFSPWEVTGVFTVKLNQDWQGKIQDNVFFHKDIIFLEKQYSYFFKFKCLYLVPQQIFCLNKYCLQMCVQNPCPDA